MKKDGFAKSHPIVNFIFFLLVIGCCVVIQHPAYILAGCISGILYYLILYGKKGFQFVGMMCPMFLLITFLNPLINTRGNRVLCHVFGRPYTLEALCYGMAIGGIFMAMMFWFGCYNKVFTSDKFTSLFGNLIPAISLLLVMVLRLIPGFTRKLKEIVAARSSIGKGIHKEEGTRRQIQNGLNLLSAMTDWALEGSIMTADSMRARGYGVGKRTSFQIHYMTIKDVSFLIYIGLFFAIFLAFGDIGAAYTPRLYAGEITIGYYAYCVLLLFPVILHVWEEIKWHNLKSKI